MILFYWTQKRHSFCANCYVHSLKCDLDFSNCDIHFPQCGVHFSDCVIHFPQCGVHLTDCDLFAANCSNSPANCDGLLAKCNAHSAVCDLLPENCDFHSEDCDVYSPNCNADSRIVLVRKSWPSQTKKAVLQTVFFNHHFLTLRVMNPLLQILSLFISQTLYRIYCCRRTACQLTVNSAITKAIAPARANAH